MGSSAGNKSNTDMMMEENNIDSDDNTESSSNDSDSESSDESSDESSENASSHKGPQAMDTDVGFDWGTEDFKQKRSTTSHGEPSDSSDDDSVSDGDVQDKKSNHKSRKKVVEK